MLPTAFVSTVLIFSSIVLAGALVFTSSIRKKLVPHCVRMSARVTKSDEFKNSYNSNALQEIIINRNRSISSLLESFRYVKLDDSKRDIEMITEYLMNSSEILLNRVDLIAFMKYGTSILVIDMGENNFDRSVTIDLFRYEREMLFCSFLFLCSMIIISFNISFLSWYIG
jgi:hypothetical protein